MRKICGLLLSIAVTTTAFTAIAAPAGASAASDASQFLALTNQVRAQKGLPALAAHGGLVSMAQGWSNKMAAAGDISHNPSLSAQAPSNWQRLGENVGMGPSVSSIQQAFVNSPHHYANIVNGEFRHVGIAVAYSGTTIFVTVDFMRTFQDGTAAAPAAAPAAKPAPAAKAPAAKPVAAAPRAATPTAVPAKATAVAAATPAPNTAPAPAATPAPPAPKTPPAQLTIVLSQLRALDQHAA
jgi:hypothetical protein